MEPLSPSTDWFPFATMTRNSPICSAGFLLAEEQAELEGVSEADVFELSRSGQRL
jgi:hypothetical protein